MAWRATVDSIGGFKPANRSRDVQGLYLAGGAAHPGPGMPMVLMSGWIAADSIDQDRVARGVTPPTRTAAAETPKSGRCKTCVQHLPPMNTAPT